MLISWIIIGLPGQAGAIKHGVAKALQNYDPEKYRPRLKKGNSFDPHLPENKYNRRLPNENYVYTCTHTVLSYAHTTN